MRVTSFTDLKLKLWMNNYYVINHKYHVSYVSDKVINFHMIPHDDLEIK
jgi:hypothetical protein